MKRKKSSLLCNNFQLDLMMLPGILVCLLFAYLPMFGLIMAFQDYNLIDGFSHSEWIGIENFARFFRDEYSWRIIRNTVLLNIYNLLFVFTIPIGFALCLNELRDGIFKRVSQTISYLPYFISTVVLVGIIQLVLAQDGVVNRLVMLCGGLPVNFLMRPAYFRTIYITSELWQFLGWNTIIFLAALSGIDPSLYEAAQIDGASRFQRMRYISLPGITTVICTLLILQLASILNIGFEKVYLLYNPSTYETADVISTYLYRKSFQTTTPEFGYSAAVGMIQSVVGGGFVLIGNMVTRKLNNTSLI